MKKTWVLIICLMFALFLFGCTKTFNVSFVSNCEETVAGRTVNQGDVLTDLPQLTLEGKQFDGWFFDTNFATKYEDQAIEEDTTLYAKWSPLVYTVSFYNGSTLLKEQQVEHGLSATAPVISDVDGMTFKQWDKAFTNVTSDLVVTAIYEANKYLVSFYSDGVIIGTPQSIEHGNAATAPANPTKEGYDFTGWDKEFTNVTGNLAINAKYVIKEFAVKFMHDNVQIGETQYIKYNSAAEAPTAPVVEGFIFTGWDKAFDKITENTVVTAVYEEIPTYNVQFMVDGTLFDEQVVKSGEAATAPTPTEKTGYTFTGWDKAFDNVTSNLVVNAIYTINKYAVKFYDGEIQIGDTQMIDHGSDATDPGAMDKDGYTFTGWDKEFTNVTSDLIINAQFTITTFSIKYYDGTTAITTLDPNTFTYESEITLPKAVDTEYSFVGWHQKADLSDSIISSIKGSEVMKDIELYARFVKFDYDGGTITWTSGSFDSTNTPGAGIDNISDLPEIFEQDFFTYLKDNNLLAASKISSELQATTWAKFSGINPLHSSDPRRIWNDTSTNVSGGSPGYVGAYLYNSATGDAATGELFDISGGFLGTEPYKTKYWFLAQHLAALQMFKYPDNSFFSPSDANRNLTAFIIDGYFYGTQGASTGGFAALRGVIPGTNFGYKMSGTSTVSMTKDYVITTDLSAVNKMFVVPVKVGFVFDGWQLNDTKELTLSLIPNRATLKATYKAIG